MAYWSRRSIHQGPSRDPEEPAAHLRGVTQARHAADHPNPDVLNDLARGIVLTCQPPDVRPERRLPSRDQVVERASLTELTSNGQELVGLLSLLGTRQGSTEIVADRRKRFITPGSPVRTVLRQQQLAGNGPAPAGRLSVPGTLCSEPPHGERTRHSRRTRIGSIADNH